MNTNAPTTTTKNRATPLLSMAIQWDAQADRPPFSELSNAQLRRWAKACFCDPTHLTVRMVGETEGRELNRDFRGKDYATNVLTFPMELPPINDPQANMPTFMADIVICTPVVEREAREQGKDPLEHFAHLLIHGCLHAQGYDHETEAQANLMENREIEILKRFKIANPYEGHGMLGD